MMKKIKKNDLKKQTSTKPGNIGAGDFWYSELIDMPEKCSFPYDYIEAVPGQLQPDEVKFTFTGELFSKLMAVSNRSDVRLHIILAAGAVLLLNRYSGHKDIIVGAPIYKQNIQGDFINTILPLRNHLHEKMTFKDLLLQVSRTIRTAAENQNFPIKALLDRLNLPYAEGDDFPLFDIAVLLDNIHDRKHLQSIYTNMTFAFSRKDQSVEGVVQFNSNRWDKKTIEKITGHLMNLLREAIFNVDLQLIRVPILAEDEIAQLIYEFNNTEAGYPAEKTIHGMFEDQVQRTPGNIAASAPIDLSPVYDWLENGTIKGNLFKTLEPCCFKKSPYIFQNPWKTGKEKLNLILLKTVKHNSVIVNNNLVKLMDFFDGKSNIQSIFSRIKDMNLRFLIYFMNRIDLLEITHRFNREPLVFCIGKFEDFVSMVQSLYHNHLIELSGVNPRAHAHDLGISTEDYFEPDVPVDEHITFENLTQQNEAISETHVLLLGDTPGTATTGLLYLASYLKRNGINVRCLFHDPARDFQSMKNNILDILNTLKPKIVAVSMKWYLYINRVFDICQLVKTYDKNITVVVGGNTASYYWDRIIQNESIDYVIRGDGELPLLKLCRQEKNIPNSVYKKDEKIIENSFSYAEDETNCREIYLSHLEEILIFPRNSIAGTFFIYTHKGCSMNCFYCGGCNRAQQKTFNRKQVFRRRIQEVRKDITAAMEFASTFQFDFYFPDESLLDYCKQVWEGIDLSNHFCIFSTYKPAPAALVELVSRTFQYVYWDFDICTLSRGHREQLFSLGLVKPQPTDEDILAFMSGCEKYPNIEVRLNLINGLPYFTLEDIEIGEKLLSGIINTYSCFGELHWARLHAQPGAPVVENAKKHDMYSTAVTFEDFLEFSRKNLNRQSPYPDPEEFEYPYIYFNTDELNSRITRFYLETNSKIRQLKNNRLKQAPAIDHLTYELLDKNTNRLADVLRAKGVIPGTIVGIMVPPSLHIPTAILAVLKAGGAFLPVSPRYPAQRIQYMLADSGVNLLLTTGRLIEERKIKKMITGREGEIIELSGSSIDNHLNNLSREGKRRKKPEKLTGPFDLSYLIYTSGTTGKPKGVMLTHENLVNYVHWFIRAAQLSGEDKTILTSSFAFDLGYTSIFPSILKGGQLHLVPRDLYLLAEELLKYIKQERITYIKVTPSLLNVMVNSRFFSSAMLRRLRIVVVGGEAINVQDIKKLHGACPHIKVMNHYGPTEATVGTVARLIDFETFDRYQKNPTIGRPINNVNVYILDRHLNLLPGGVPGELCISGICLARGYLNHPEFTFERFINCKFKNTSYLPGSTHSTLYRTGDLARWRQDGNIQFLGRIDNQVKIRGYRIELEEIEKQLLQHDEIEEAVVTCRQDNSGDSYICAYYVPVTGNEKGITRDARSILTKNEETRYKRQMLLPGWGSTSQEKLKQTTVFVAGAGGGASPTLMQLALLGFGTIIVCDYDPVELSNLNRQFLHDQSRIGMNKALSAKLTINQVNPHVEIIPLTAKLTRENVFEQVGDSVIIFDMFDDLEAKFILSECAAAKDIPHIIAAMTDISSYAAIFHPPRTPCFHCLFDKNKLTRLVSGMKTALKEKEYEKNPLPVSAPSLFVSTGFALNEAVKIILGIRNPAYNKFFFFNQGGTENIGKSEGYRAMTYTYSDHFRKISREQGVDWDIGWRGKFLEELKIIPDPDCTICGNINNRPSFSNPLETHNQENICQQSLLDAPVKPETGTLREYLLPKLPEYMVPAHFVKMKEMPLTPNGKLDRKALPGPDISGKVNGYTPPRNEIEGKLTEIWSEVLGIEKTSIGIDDNFFEMGGHSLKVTLLLSRIHKELNGNIPMTEVFRSPDIRRLSEYLTGIVEDTYYSIKAAEKKDYYPLSPAQNRLYILQQMELESTAYNVYTVVELAGEIELDSLQEAFRGLINRHESLRTSFRVIDGTPVQEIRYPEELEFKVVYYNLEEDGPVEQVFKKFSRPFDLSRSPLVRVGLVEIEPLKHVLMVNMHHIITDGVSHRILIDDFVSLYEGRPLPRLRLQYRDYSQWQQNRAAAETFNKQQEYWLHQFEVEIPLLNMPCDYSRPPIQSFAGDVLSFYLSGKETRKLNDLARSKGATLFMVLLAIYNIFLSKISGQEDIVVGTPTAGRKHADLEPIIGIFINMLALRNSPGGGEEHTFTEFLIYLKEMTLKAFENQDYPFENLVEKLPVQRDMSRNPLFDVSFFFRNMFDAPGKMPERKLEGLQVKPYPHESKSSKFDLTLSVHEVEEKLYLSFQYSTGLFKEETVKRFIKYIKNIISQVIDNPQKKISGIEISTEEEKNRILYDFNDTGVKFSKNKVIHRLFEEQVDRTPDNIAVKAMGQGAGRNIESCALTYKELNKKSNQLAGVLREKGVHADSITGLMTDRSIEMMVGLLGILKAGGGYLPLDPVYPGERIKYILEDSGASLILTGKDQKKLVGSGYETLELEDDNIYRGKSHNPEKVNKPTDLVYVIYTSGSTGRPKGVIIENRSLVNFITGITAIIPFGESDCILSLTTLSFDIFGLETILPLTKGARVIIGTREEQLNPGDSGLAISRQGVTILQLTPAGLSMLISNEKSVKGLKSLKYLLVGGETFPQLLLDKARKVTGGRIYNLYGPTETTIWSTVKEVSTGKSLNIGKPTANTGIYILGGARCLQPPGIAGELCISGVGLARGYINNADITREKFISHPFEKGELLYRTGDTARWLPHGNIEFLGRYDHQVKIRGFRIEPGEIERQLLTHGTVKEAVVIDREAADGDRFLCAYIVPAREVEVAVLREYLSACLPGYMVPSYFVFLEKIPLTANRKVNRKALPAPGPGIMAGEKYTPPGNEIQRRLVRIWSDVLDIEYKQIGIDANFFELGGHSLKATIAVSRIHKEFNVKMPLTEMFKMQTIRKLSGYIKGAEKNRYAAINPSEKKEYYALSSAQKRVYFLQQMEQKAVGYNMPLIMMLEGPINTGRFRETFLKLIQKHESLRTSFEMIEENPVQEVRENVEFAVEYYEKTGNSCWSMKNSKGKSFKSPEEIIENFVRPFNLSDAPLLRVGLIHTPSLGSSDPGGGSPGKQEQSHDDTHILMVDIHHIITDGTSRVILTGEFMRHYSYVNTYSDGLSFEMSLPLRIQYKDYACWQNNSGENQGLKKQQAYWLDEFKEEIPVLNLPADYPRPALRSFAGRAITFEIGKEKTAQLKELAIKQGATLFMVLLGVFNLLLSKLSGQEDIVIGIPTAGRRHPELENILGMFVNTLAMRNYPSPGKTFKEFLIEVKERTLGAFENQEYQLEDLVDKIVVNRNTGRNPLFDVVLVLQNMETAKPDIPELKIRPYKYDFPISKFDLTLTGFELPGKLQFSLRYWSKLFKEKTIKKFIAYFRAVIDSVLENPGVKLSGIDIVSEAEKYRLLSEFNNSTAEYPEEKTINRIFAEKVDKTPDNMALAGPGVTGQGAGSSPHTASLTYRELNNQSHRLAGLLREKGIKSEIIVGIMVDRSIELVTGVLGVLKAGGAYLPIDPEYPEERIEFMLADSAAHVLITNPGVFEKDMNPGRWVIKKLHPGASLCLNSSAAGPHRNRERPEEHWSHSPPSAANLAYIIYTSGTTGKPKGVMIRHGNVVQLMTPRPFMFDFNAGDVWTLFHSFCFDFSVWEMYGSLLYGGKLIVIPPVTARDSVQFLEILKRENVTILNQTPAAFYNLAHLELLQTDTGTGTGKELKLRYVIFGGDVLNPVKLKKWKEKYPQTKLINMYGITETTVHATYKEIGDRDIRMNISNIGKPLPTLRAYITDKNLRLLPIGVAGELCLGGHGVGRGYLNRPGLTNEKFAGNIYKPGERLYKSGDLVKWLDNGDMEYLGRIDQQVKIRGYRIELGEIQNQLHLHKQIKEAVVTAKEDANRDKYLCAYIVAGKKFDLPELKEYLARRLPGYMIPAYFVQIDNIPLTPTGKVDRNALPDPIEMNSGNEGDYLAPANPLERKLVEIWQQVLGRKNPGINDNFFTLGGDSIKAIQLISRMKREGYLVEMKDIFLYPFISQLSSKVRTVEFTADQSIVTGIVPLTPIQARFFRQPLDSPHHYNQAVMLHWAGRIDRNLIEDVFSRLQEHHDALRMVFKRSGKNGTVRQINNNVKHPLWVREYDLCALAEQEDVKNLIEARANEIQAGIDLEKGPLMKLGLFHLDDGDRLLMVVHHLVIDGLSWRILIEDIETLVSQYKNNETYKLPLKTDSYKMWAENLARYADSEKFLKEKAYWIKSEALARSVPGIEKDFKTFHPGNSSSVKVKRSFQLSEEETERLLTGVNHAFGTEINDILLTSLGLAFKKTYGLQNLLIGLEGHGREDIFPGVDISRTVGWFTSIYPLVLEMSRENDLARQIKEVKESVHRVPNKGIGYGILKYLTSKKNKTEFSFHPEPQILFNYLGQFDAEPGEKNFRVAGEPVGNTRGPGDHDECDFSINGMISNRRLVMSIAYNNRHYKPATIETLTNNYHTALISVINFCASGRKSEPTPGDFTYKELSIDTLDAIAADVKVNLTDIEDIYPLSPMQEGMLFHWLQEKDIRGTPGPTFFEQLSYRIQGNLDIPLVEKSLNQLVKRHDILRAVFNYNHHVRPLQVVLKSKKMDFYYEDIRKTGSVEKREEFIKEFKNKDRERAFDLKLNALMRVSILRTGPSQYEFTWSFHHILMDGWCIGILNTEFFEIYNSFLEKRACQLPGVKPYRTYIQWLQRQDRGISQKYWSGYLASYEEAADIPGKGIVEIETPPGTGNKNSYKNEGILFVVDAEKTNRLNRLARKNHVTLNILLQCIWAIILGKYNGKEDVVFGAVVSGRPPELEEVESMVGLFINTIPVRIRFEHNLSFKNLLHEVQRKAITGEPHHYFPLAEIQAGSILRQNLLTHIFIFENYPVARQVKTGEPSNKKAGDDKSNDDNGARGLTLSGVEVFEQSNYDFNILAAPGKQLTIKFYYNGNVYHPGFMNRIPGHFSRVIGQVLDDEGLSIGGITLLSEEERTRLIHDFNDSSTDYPQLKKIHEIFALQAESTPDHIVLTGKENKNGETIQLTYKELDKTTNRLGAILREKGGEPGAIMAILAERSVEMAIGILGIVKSGGAYLPIDPNYPEDRIRFMLEDSKASLLLTTRTLAEKVNKLCPPDVENSNEIIFIDSFKFQSPSSPLLNVSSSQLLASPGLLYIIYTSGSTGKPKGIMITHENAAARLVKTGYIDVEEDDRLLMTGSIAFDIATFELWWPLLNGLSLYLVNREAILDAQRLRKVLTETCITVMHLTPQLFNQLAQQEPGIFAKLRCFLVGGDLVKPFYVNFIRNKYPYLKVLHMYGPTENTVFSSFLPVKSDYSTNIPIGTPVGNCCVYILDNHLQLQPIGVVGELCVSGPGVSMGYLNNPGLTVENFINYKRYPLQNKKYCSYLTLYRTGDLARWLPDGNIEFMGRKDHQVKIRGFRIELREIEKVLLTHPMVVDCAVVPGEIKENIQLAAYYVTRKKIRLWPSLAEYFVYDDLLYHSMVRDEARNEKYRNAIRKVIKGKTVLEIGPGSEAILSRICIEEGAKKVYAVEILEEACQKAKKQVKSLGLEDRIILIHGDICKVKLPEQVDYCISEIVGSIGGSEGAAGIINSARNLLIDSKHMIPGRSLTKIAAITLPPSQFEPGFDEIGAHYVEKVFEHVGYKFDLRLCLVSFPARHVISSAGVFENLDFTRENVLEGEHEIYLEIGQSSILNGFIVWLNLYVDDDEVIDSLENKYIWLPVYLPVFSRGEPVEKGDYIRATVTRKLSGSKVNPDFIIKGQLHRKDAAALDFCYHCPHIDKRFKSNPFYREIFSEDGLTLKVTGNVAASDLKKLLSSKLPDYMVPAHFVEIDRIPLTANGKVNRKDLPDPVIGIRRDYAPPTHTIEKKLVEMWSEILGIEKEIIGINSGFFDLGGHSLKATILTARIHKELKVKISLAEIFQLNTIGNLAGYLRKAEKAEYTGITPIEKREYYVASSAQKRLYFIQQLNLTGIGYNMPLVINLGKNTQLNKLENTLKKLITRHESLRTSFIMVGEEPVQKIYEEIEFEIEYIDLGSKYKWGQASEWGQVETTITNTISSFVRPFDLTRGPLIRSGLIRVSEDHYTWIVDMHHIISDGTSHMVLKTDFQALSCGRELESLRVQYKDFSQWQNRMFENREIKKQEDYWLSGLKDDIPRLELPVDFKRPNVFTFSGDSYSFQLEREQALDFNTLGARNGATLYMNFLAAINTLFYKYTGQTDIIIGGVIAGRHHADLQDTIGMFVNTLAMRNFPVSEKSYETFLKEVAANSLNAFENQQVQFETLVDRLDLERDPARNPIFDISMLVQNFKRPGKGNPGEGEENEENEENTTQFEVLPLTGAGTPGAGYKNNTAKFDLTFIIREIEETISVKIEYYTGIFKEETIKRLALHLKNLVSLVGKEPSVRLKDIVIISGEEKKQILFDFNDTRADYPVEKTIHRLFAEQVEHTPDHVALIGQIQDSASRITGSSDQKKDKDVSGRPVLNAINRDVSITYRKLHEQSNRLAGELKENGSRADTIVGIMMERSIEMMVGILAVLKSGSAYLPMDPELPRERIHYMLADSNAMILLTTGETARGIESGNCPLLIVNSQQEEPDIHLSHQHPVIPANAGLRRQLAYIIYTSGSTGKPKGVMIQHDSIVNTLVWRKNYYAFDRHDTAMQIPSISFDSSVTDIFTPLISGAKLVLIQQQHRFDLEYLGEMIRKNHVTHFIMVPIFYKTLLREIPGSLTSLKTITIGGDYFTGELVKNHFALLKQVKLYNEYGPTENSVCTTAYRFNPPELEVLIGKPIHNNTCYIIGEDSHLCPVGIPGELCISGVGLARGYLNQPELTFDRFVNYKLQNTKYKQITNYNIQITNKLYQTGDLARWLGDGNIEFLGRMDHQVKIRGFRIESGEIEAQLLRHALIKEAAVISGEQENGEKYLIGYIVREEAFDLSQLTGYLSKSLPDYMIPAYFVAIDKIPLTASGKLSRKDLPVPGSKKAKVYVAPRDDMEEKLVKIWREVLGRNTAQSMKISIDDNFFDLGGHSLKATVVISRIHKELELKCSLAELFKFPTVRGLSAYLEKASKDHFLEIQSSAKKEYYALSFNQKRLWIIQQMDPNDNSYNMPGMIPFNRHIDKNVINEVIGTIIQRHESLRTCFKVINGKAVQYVVEKYQIPLETADISSIGAGEGVGEGEGEETGKEKETALRKITDEFNLKPFQLDKPLLFRSLLIKVNAARYIFAYNMHHIISDGWSMEILERDFHYIFHSFLNNTPVETNRNRILYKDFCQWQDKMLEETLKGDISRDFWIQFLGEELPPLQLPGILDSRGNADGNRRSNSKSSATLRFVIGKDIKEALKQLSQKYSLTLFVFLYSLYNIFLSIAAGQRTVVSSMVSAGRDHPSLQDIVGFFVNSIIFKKQINHEDIFIDFARQVREQVFEFLKHQYYPLELVLDEVGIKYPEVTASFNMINTKNLESVSLENPDSYHSYTKQNVKFDLEVYVLEFKNGIEIKMSYNTGRFKQENIEFMMKKYRKLIEFFALNPLKRIKDYKDKKKGKSLKKKYKKEKINPPLKN